MKGKIGTPCSISYKGIYLPKKTFKLVYYEKLPEKAKIKLKAINLYKSKKYTVEQICEIFEIDRSTFYRWRKFFYVAYACLSADRYREPNQKLDLILNIGYHYFKLMKGNLIYESF